MIKVLEKTLKESFIFGDFSTEEISRLAQICSIKKVAAEQRIFVEGERGDSLFVVSKGNVRIYQLISETYAKTLAILGPGGLFGEESFVSERSRSSSAMATEPTWIVELTRSDFNVIFTKQPVFGLKVLKRLASIIGIRVRATTDRIYECVGWAQEARKWSHKKGHALSGASGVIEIAVRGEGSFVGRIVQVQKGQAGCSILWESRKGRIHWTPYHALRYMRLSDQGAKGRLADGQGDIQGLKQ